MRLSQVLLQLNCVVVNSLEFEVLLLGLQVSNQDPKVDKLRLRSFFSNLDVLDFEEGNRWLYHVLRDCCLSI